MKNNTKTVTIGRLPENDIVVNVSSVSRHHAKITETASGTYEIEDLQSKHGTYVNGRKVKGHSPVHSGDRIVLATTPLTSNWVQILNQKENVVPEVESSPSKPDPEPQEVITLQNDTVLYDFAKDTERFFAEFSQNVLQIIDTFKRSHYLVKRPHTSKHYSEELFDISLEQYQFGCVQMIDLMSRLERECATFDKIYEDDLRKLDNTYQYRLVAYHSSQNLSSSLREVDDKKTQYRCLYEQAKKQVMASLYPVFDDFYEQNPPLYPNRYELAPATSLVWNNLNNRSDDVQSTFYLGEDEVSYPLFQEAVSFKTRSYVHTLCGGNIQMVYDRKHREECFGITNTLISRMLTSVPNGGAHVIMVDLYEMEGTSNIFKNLNRKVFHIISRYDDFLKLLNGLYVHIENVIQNLLKGEITCLSDYNKGKTNKEAYQLLVLKDVPMGGYGGEVWGKLEEIMRNGPRAGVSVVVMVNNDVVNSSEEMLKGYNIMQNAIKSISCETIKLLTQENPNNQESVSHNLHYDTLPEYILSDVVRKINQEMEVKTETVLHFNDYMLPEKEWWTGQSANRIDVPFGISTDMQTQALHITQVSGQNSAVVIGNPGSGKSVFLHTLITNAVIHYSPKELQLYLLDFSGVEFNTYAQHKLPHARVIAPEAEREFGLSILKELKKEGERRMNLCRDNDVTNIVELKERNPDMIVPRLLVIIDEFQKLFEIDNDKISQEANRYIHVIIQEYRKFGINLILATQKLPSKSILPRDMIANRVVFESGPSDFSELIIWDKKISKPRLGNGVCVYNDKFGSEECNNVTRGFFIKASTDLNLLLDKISNFANVHQEMLDKELTMRVFRGGDLPDFNKKVMDEKHFVMSNIPKEVGVYVGESIAITATDVYVPLVKESNNNILIIGGRQDVAKRIAYYSILSQSIAHNDNTATLVLCNFMRNDDELQTLYNSEQIEAIKQSSQWFDARKADEVSTVLGNLKGLIDYRKNLDDESEMQHVYLHITSFQLGRMFDMGGSSGDRSSDCSKLLEAILKDGPSLGIFTVLQVDNLNNLNRLGRGALNLFNHRIALQMPENESNKVVGTAAANKLKVSGRPSSEFRALYFNYVNNEMTKFKPYK